MAKVLAFVRKNILIIICGVIAVAAIVSIFWPIDGYFASLQTDVDARKSAYATATTLLRKSRTLPVLDPQTTDPQPLNVFPTDSVIARGTSATEAIGEESKAMLQTAMTLVKHNPLVANALPDGGTMDATFFLRQYQQIMTFPSSDPDQMANSLPVTILHAGMPPAEAEITARQTQVSNDITNRFTEKDASGNPINAPDVAAKVDQAVALVPVQMRTDAATKNQMYIAPDAFHINPSLTGVNPPGTVAMFNGQIGLWLLQDVFSALASANADCQGGVPHSRVKHLIKIDFADAPFSPVPQSTDPNAPPTPSDPLHPQIKLNVSPTGHVSNGLYDVIPFSLRIVVDAQQVPAVLQALSKDRFITVLRMDMLTVDSGAAVLAGYLYGDKPVVQLNLSCEELFFRADTLPYMPDSIKKALNIAPPPAAAAPQ
jgi:hypothetical protein